MQLQGVNYKGAFALEAAVEDRCEAHARDWTRNAKRVRGDPGQADLRRSARSRNEDRGSDVLLRAARARVARRVARARIQTQYWGAPQPPSGELAPLSPRRAAEYVRAISVFTQRPLPSKVFSLSPLTQYILDPSFPLPLSIRLRAGESEWRSHCRGVPPFTAPATGKGNSD